MAPFGCGVLHPPSTTALEEEEAATGPQPPFSSGGKGDPSPPLPPSMGCLRSSVPCLQLKSPSQAEGGRIWQSV